MRKEVFVTGLKVAVLVVAAGSSNRFGGPRPKQYEDLGGKSVLHRTLNAFVSHPGVYRICVAIADGYESEFEEALSGLNEGVLPTAVRGGATRQGSVRLGLESLADEAPDLVLIHDGARPFPDGLVVSKIIQKLEHNPELDGAFAALPATDTLRRIDETGQSFQTVAREGLWRAQTPQGFRFKAILAAHRNAMHDDFTDDVAVGEAQGLKCVVVDDVTSNFKISTQADLQLAQSMVEASSARPSVTRTGFGYDVHRFEKGRPLFLCGVELEDESEGLKGHSDADVALHALVDALLGALGMGDIGQHFPPSDLQWKDAPSSFFIESTMEKLRNLGGTLNNADITLICEKPKIAHHREKMRLRVAELLDVFPQDVNIKATTTEGLGFAGRGEGIAAQAIVSVSLPRSSAAGV
jgi:2-C-methyl-D-erythritol 4-phosphate cytidylyltransferase / 2-C-methyl-D-erythritol 2,4-cyclodiphosphate synthase